MSIGGGRDGGMDQGTGNMAGGILIYALLIPWDVDDEDDTQRVYIGAE